jgi:hypothetical protein
MKSPVNIIIFISSLFILFISCAERERGSDHPQTKEEEAKNAISAAIKKQLPHPETYQALSFGSLDSTFSAADMDSARYYQELSEYYIGKAEETLPVDFAKSGKYSDSSLYYSRKVRQYLSEFKPQFNGYKMEHTYQAGSAANLLTKESVTVYFDTTLQITSVD